MFLQSGSEAHQKEQAKGIHGLLDSFEEGPSLLLRIKRPAFNSQLLPPVIDMGESAYISWNLDRGTPCTVETEFPSLTEPDSTVASRKTQTDVSIMPSLCSSAANVQKAVYFLTWRLSLGRPYYHQYNIVHHAPLPWIMHSLRGFTCLPRKLLQVAKPAVKGESIETV